MIAWQKTDDDDRVPGVIDQSKVRPGLAGELVRFAEFLKSNGFRIFQSSIVDSLKGLDRIDISRREDFFNVLRANFAMNDLEWAQFEGLFSAFWSPEDPEKHEPQTKHPVSERRLDKTGSSGETAPDMETEAAAETMEGQVKNCLEGISYSPLSSVTKKDLSQFGRADFLVAQLALKRMIEPFKIQASRRKKRSRKAATLDFPRSMRKSLKGEGIPLELFFKEKKKRLKRLVVLADVSGSMDQYARFVMPFIMGLRGIGSRAEVFVFATSLTRVTTMVRHMSLVSALERISQEVPDWSGGTRIGYSFHQFNQKQGRKLLNRRTVVVILSDGWDLGAKELLRREMETLSREAHCVIWLNPLAGDPDFQAVNQGMGKVALPYVDYLLPVNSLENLQRVGRLLSRVMVH